MWWLSTFLGLGHPHAGVDASSQGCWAELEVVTSPSGRLGTELSVSDCKLSTCFGYSMSLLFPTLTQWENQAAQCCSSLLLFLISFLHVFEIGFSSNLEYSLELSENWEILSNYRAFWIEVLWKIMSYVCLVWEQLKCLNLHLHAWKSPLDWD